MSYNFGKRMRLEGTLLVRTLTEGVRNLANVSRITFLRKGQIYHVYIRVVRAECVNDTVTKRNSCPFNV